MKKKLIVSLFSLVLVLGLMAGCGLGNKGKSASGADEKTDQSTSKSGKTTKASDKVDLSDMQQIGEDGYGYVYVPSDWIKFHDIATGGAGYQYADPSTYNVVTLYSYTAEDLGVTAIDSDAVEQAANSYAYNIEQQGTFDNLTGAMVEIGGYEAYQVYGTLKSDGKILCAWIFKTEKSDKVYLVSLEGDRETFFQVLPAIEETWSETK